ncbi:MAG: FKBP-type peptidyl-prolyl cis-trans isomerase [Candidatus Thorarchaeota archaeon]
MSRLHRKIPTIILLTLFITSGVMAFIPVAETGESNTVAHNGQQQNTLAESSLNVSIPYVDAHYGSADGIIDPTEYSSSYTDPATGITVYMEHNSTFLYVGLSAQTSGWIAMGWNNDSSIFASQGINGSNLIYGYAPGNPYQAFPRVGGAESVTVHYVLSVRNGTVLEEGNVPNDESTTPIAEEALLQQYKDEIIGMRIGEVRHFIIPAEDAYNSPIHPMYGNDLEYIITLTRIDEVRINPTVSSEIVFSEEIGTSTYNHVADTNQSRIVLANATDDGLVTSLEYFIRMNSTDPNDIPLLADNDIQYPIVLMFGDNENIHSLPVQHTDWSTPIMAQIIPNELPTIIFENPTQDSNLEWVTSLSLNVTDNSYVRRTFYKVNDDDWSEMFYDFQTDLWETSVDLSEYGNGAHTIWVNATDPSNATALEYVNITIDRSYIPLLGMKLSVVRTLTTALYHTTEISDKFTVTNNGSAPINAIEIFLPIHWSSNFLSINGIDSAGNELEILRVDSDDALMKWRIYLAAPVGFQETGEFTVSTHCHSLHSISIFEQNQYDVTYMKHPIVPYVLTSSELIIEFRAGDSYPDPETKADGMWSNLPPMQTDEYTFPMKSYTPFIVAERDTEITVDPWGWLSFKETISLDNIGPTRETIVLFTLPAYTTSVKVYDTVGILAASQPNSEWELNTTVDLQIDLTKDRFGVDGFWPGFQYTFFIDYTIQLDPYQTVVNEGTELQLPTGTLGDILVTTHVTDLVLPWSVAPYSIDGDYRQLYGVFDNTLRYTDHNTTQENPIEIVIVYQTTISSSARPIIFALIIGLVAAVYVAFRRVEMIEIISGRSDGDEDAAEQRQTGAPPEELNDFANIYSRKTALSMDLEKLESSRRKGKVSKKEYMIRDKDIKAQIDSIDAQLPELKERLMRYGAKYRDLISQLELQDERIQGAKAGLRQLLIRKKKQRISRVAFEKSKQDYLKTIKKATSATDRILLSIQEEAGDV